MNLCDYIGESSTCEKKQAAERRKPKSWPKSVRAFANSLGGTLIFGVADDGSLMGLGDSKVDSEFISQKIKERLDPVPESFGLVNAEGKLTHAGALLADDSPMKWSRLSPRNSSIDRAGAVRTHRLQKEWKVDCLRQS